MTTQLKIAVAKVQAQTHDNDHTGAILTMAEYVARKHNQLDGVSSLVKAANSVIELHKFYGHMPSHLNQIRDEVSANCEMLMSDEEKTAFHNAR